MEGESRRITTGSRNREHHLGVGCNNFRRKSDSKLSHWIQRSSSIGFRCHVVQSAPIDGCFLAASMLMLHFGAVFPKRVINCEFRDIRKDNIFRAVLE